LLIFESERCFLTLFLYLNTCTRHITNATPIEIADMSKAL
jgi:hypothetical protein